MFRAYICRKYINVLTVKVQDEKKTGRRGCSQPDKALACS